jgi:ankyrin repeat protein
VAGPHDAFDAVAAGDADRLRAILRDEPRVAAARDEAHVSLVRRARYAMRDDLVEIVLAAGPELDVHDAAAVGDADRLNALVDSDPELVRALASDGFAPVHLAAFFRQPHAVRLLLDRGADADVAAANDSRVTPLHSAAASGDRDCMRLLLEAGADPNAQQRGGFVPLHAASAAGDREMAELLLAHGAEPVAEG